MARQKERTLQRRSFLKGVGSASLALPFLPSWAGRAWGQSSQPGSEIRRVIFFTLPLGAVQEQWFPSDESRVGVHSIGAQAKQVDLAAIAGAQGGDLSSIFQSSNLSGVMDKMIFLDGIDGPSTSGHEKSYSLTGFVRDEPQALPGPSIDQIIAAKANLYESEPAFRSMNIASGPGTHAGSSISYTVNGNKVVPIPQLADSATVWDLAFQWVSSGGATANADFEKQRGLRLSITDHVNKRFDAFKSHSNLSCVDRSRAESYFQYLSEYESSIKNAKLIECATPLRPDVGSYGRGDGRWPRYEQDQVDNIIHIVRCGLTNVVTFNVEPSARRYSHLPGVTSDHHGLSHGKSQTREDEGAAGQLLEVGRHHVGLLARLIRGLDVEEDPGTGRTFLDNSIVLVGNDMGSVVNHGEQRIPCLLFGGKGLLKQGKLIDFRSEYTRSYNSTFRTAKVGISYNRLLVTVCQAMGLTPDDYELGQQGIGDYSPSSFYYREFPGGHDEYVDYAYGDRRALLSELLV